MTVAITAELYGDGTPRPVLVTVTGLTGVDRVNVYREAPSTGRALVRGGVDVTPSSSALVLVDTEAELGRPLVYVAESYVGSTATETSAPPVEVPDPGRHVLSDPLTGTGVLVDVVLTDDERENTHRGAVLYVQGRARPVVLTDARSSDVVELVVYARDSSEAAQLVELLAPGRPVVSRHPWNGADIPGVEVLHVTDSKRARRSRAGDRVFTLSAVVVDSPDPRLAVSLVDLGDLAAAYPGTLATLAADFPTLLDLARDPLGAI